MPIVAILGATSPIANVVARQFAAEGCDLVLTARDPHAIAEAADRIATGFSINVEHHALDAGDEQSVSALIESFGEHFPDVVICLLGKQEEAGQSRAETVVLDGLVSANLVMPAMLLERCAAKMMERGSGSIIGVSSIVGDRGRQKNYWYGAAKAGFTAYLSGLRQRLTPLGIHVMTVKPGVVAIPGRSSGHPAWRTTSPETVAADIYQGWIKRRHVIYTPWYWRWVMLVVRLIPESLFRRLSF